MKVKYNINHKDYIKTIKYGTLNVPKARKENIKFLVCFLSLMLIVFLWIRSLFQLPTVIFLSMYFIGSFICILHIIYSSLKKREKAHRDRGGFFCEHTIEINEDGVRETTSIDEIFVKWEVVNSIDQNAEYIFIFLSEVTFYFIPKRAFKSNLEADEFYNKAVNFLA